MTRASRIAVVGLALLTIALLAWSRCGGTSPERSPVDVASAPERAPTKAPAPPRRASDKTPTDEPSAPVDPATSTPAAQAAKSDAPAAPPREIVLYVADEGGAPVAGLRTYVDADADAKGRPSWGCTDAAGMWRFVAARGPRHIGVNVMVDQERCFLPAGDVLVAAAQTEVRLRLREGAAIEGRVVDENGAPAGRVTATAVGADGFVSRCSTDTDGTFRVAVPVGSRCDLRLETQMSQNLVPDEKCDGSLDGVAAGTSGVVLRCRRIAKDRTLSVVVVDPSGAPRPRAYVTLSLVVVEASRDADKNGRCKFARLPARELTVTATTFGSAPDNLYAPSLPVKVVPDGQEIVLQLRRANLVEVALVDSAGAAVRFKEIDAMRGTRRVTWGLSGLSGRATLKVPPEEVGTIRIEVREARAIGDGELLGTADVDVPTDREIRIVVGR